MVDQYVIRAARSEDSPAIVRLIFEIWVDEYAFKVAPQDFPDLHHIKHYYHERGGLFLVALSGDKIIGTIACDTLSEEVFVLKRMFVHKEFRRKGVAQKLLDTLMGQKGSRGSWYLSTKAEVAIAAKKFYLRNGFVIIERRELPSGFPFFYEDDLFMMKKIL